MKNSGPKSLLVQEQDFRAENLKGSWALRKKNESDARIVTEPLWCITACKCPSQHFPPAANLLAIFNKVAVGKIKIENL